MDEVSGWKMIGIGMKGKEKRCEGQKKYLRTKNRIVKACEGKKKQR